MKLVVKDIIKKKNRYVLDKDDGEWVPGELFEMFSETMANIVVCRRDLSNVILEGNLQGKLSSLCDRCGDGFVTDLHSDFYYLITTKEEEIPGFREVECREEDAQILYLAASEQEIDLAAILKEQTYLAIPLSNLCSDNCKGICPGCGVTLNSDKCKCSTDTEASPFAVLKNLKKN